jgi:hypothetical protein
MWDLTLLKQVDVKRAEHNHPSHPHGGFSEADAWDEVQQAYLSIFL